MLILSLRAVLSTALLALAAWGAGCWITWLLPEDSPKVERLAIPLLGGLGTLGTILFIAGQVSFSRTVIVSVLAAASCAGLVHIAYSVKSGSFSWRWSMPPKIPAAVIAFILCFTAVGGLAEITGDWNFDSITYHLLGPKVWLRQEIVRPVPDECLTAFPQTTEILFAAMLSVGGNRAPSFSDALLFGVFLLVTAALALRAGLGSHGAWWAVAIVATMPAVYEGSHSCFIDAFYASLVLAAAISGFTARQPKHFLVFGLLSGLAMGTKYTGIPAFAAILVCVLLFSMAKRGDREAVARNLSLATLAACLIASPFYIRDWILLGSPIYPPPTPLLRYFHPKYLSAETLRNFQAFLKRRNAGLGRGVLPYLLLPFDLTYRTAMFDGAGGIGLAPLGFAWVGMIAARQNRFAKCLVLLAWILLTFWFVTLQESRYFIDFYAIAAVLAVVGWRSILATTGRTAKLLSAAILGISLLYGLLMMERAQRDPVHAVFSPSYAREFREQTVPFWQSFDYLNHNPKVEKVLILDPSVPPYYSDKNYVKPFGMWGERSVPGVKTAADILPKLKSPGITDILDVRSTIQGFQVPAGTAGLTLVFELPDQRVYRVDRRRNP